MSDQELLSSSLYSNSHSLSMIDNFDVTRNWSKWKEVTIENILNTEYVSKNGLHSDAHNFSCQIHVGKRSTNVEYTLNIANGQSFTLGFDFTGEAARFLACSCCCSCCNFLRSSLVRGIGLGLGLGRSGRCRMPTFMWDGFFSSFAGLSADHDKQIAKNFMTHVMTLVLWLTYFWNFICLFECSDVFNILLLRR